jgi:hypothetical protein
MLRTANLGDPLAYRVMRAALFLPIVATPPAGPDGKLMLPPPPPDLMKRLDLMRANAKWPAIVEEAEGQLKLLRFSLDLHFRSAQALGNLGHRMPRRRSSTASAR